MRAFIAIHQPEQCLARHLDYGSADSTRSSDRNDPREHDPHPAAQDLQDYTVALALDDDDGH